MVLSLINPCQSLVVAPSRCLVAALAQQTAVLCATGVNCCGANSAVHGEPKT